MSRTHVSRIGPRARTTLRSLLIICASVGACYSFLLARAAWLFAQDSRLSVTQAVQLEPYNSTYLSRLAAWLPSERVSLLQQAVALNPFDFQSLITLGFDQEFAKHDLLRAESFYLRAAIVNQMFLPKWTLTNFYFRHGRTAEFFHWANAALAITPYSPEPIFVQMWLLSQDAKRIATAIPDRPRVLLPYAWFLSNQQRREPIAPVVDRLVRAVGKRDSQDWGRNDLLAVIEDRLVAAGDRNTALQIWTTLANGHWIKERIPDTSRPVTNGDFGTPFYQHGFDWKVLATPGVHTDQIALEKQVSLRFSGDEPENCSVIQQYIPLVGGRTYVLHWEMNSGLAAGPSGLHWTVTPISEAAAVPLMSEDLTGAQRSEWRFQTPAQTTVGLLSLQYARPRGQERARGAVVLKEVESHLE